MGLFKKKQKKPMSASKKFILYLFINCTLVEAAIIFLIFYSFPFAKDVGTLPSFEPLTTLISTVVAETIAFGIYSVKALKENTKGGVVYDAAMAETQKNDQEVPTINMQGDNQDDIGINSLNDNT